MGVIMVKAQKCRHGEVELLADIIRPQEPLGGVDKQHHRAQQRPMAANGLLEIAVKYRAHGRFADQHHSTHKQQRPGGSACNGGIQSQHQRCRQGRKLVRLPHGIKQPVPLYQAEAQGERIFFINFQPHKQRFGHGENRQNQQHRG